jgi:FkbM family methyltransferase
MERDLIFDVGAHRGDDTVHYLDRGFRVVAVEANPALARGLRDRFAGQSVTVIDAAIAEDEGQQTLWVNSANDEWSALDREAGSRGGTGTPVAVQTIPLTTLFQEFGVPYYLKCDIEGADIHCLRALDARGLPAYVSVEAHSLEYLSILFSLGYRHFKCLDQLSHNAPQALSNERVLERALRWFDHQRGRVRRQLGRERFPLSSSGPFGEETPGPWRSFEEVAYDWLHFRMGQRKRGTLNPRGWFDFHARL